MASPTVAVEQAPLSAAGVRRGRAWLSWCAGTAVLFGAVYGTAWLLRRYAIGRPEWTTAGASLLNLQWHNIAECAAIALCAAAALLFPRMDMLWLRSAEHAFTRFAAKRTQA